MLSKTAKAIVIGSACWLALIGNQAVSAQSHPADPDMRCVAIFLNAVGVSDEATRNSIMPGAMYFIGRADVQLQGADFSTELTRVLKDMTSAIVATEMQRCSALMTARGEALQALGNGMMKGD